MNLENQVKDFYSKIKFPGPYTIDNFDYYNNGYTNKFLSMYERAIQDKENILDIGCGTGFITNYLAYKYPSKKFYGVDFSDSIDYAKEFSKKHKLKNVVYEKKNFFDFNKRKKYDCIISNGVIHHMPMYEDAIIKIKSMLSQEGTLVLGVYNKFGKIAKKIINVKYRSELLRKDQEEAPFETSFSNKEVIGYFSDFDVIEIYPSKKNNFVDLKNILNYRNGGLTIYRFKRSST